MHSRTVGEIPPSVFSMMTVLLVIESANKIQHGPSPYARAFGVGMDPIVHKTARIYCIRLREQENIAAVVIKRLFRGIRQAFGCLINSINHQRRGIL